MKKLSYLLLVFGFLFSSCEEDADNPFNPNNNTSFVCKVDGNQLSDSSPDAYVITTNPALNGALKISGISNLKDATVMNEVALTIYNFSSVSENSNINLGLSGSGQVWQGAETFVTTTPNFTGTVNFSKITANMVSGTFNFEALNSSNGSTKVTITNGSFTDVSY